MATASVPEDSEKTIMATEGIVQLQISPMVTTLKMLTYLRPVDPEQQGVALPPSGGRRIFGHKIPRYSAPMVQIVVVGFILFLNPGYDYPTELVSLTYLTRSQHVQCFGRPGGSRTGRCHCSEQRWHRLTYNFCSDWLRGGHCAQLPVS